MRRGDIRWTSHWDCCISCRFVRPRRRRAVDCKPWTPGPDSEGRLGSYRSAPHVWSSYDCLIPVDSNYCQRSGLFCGPPYDCRLASLCSFCGWNRAYAMDPADCNRTLRVIYRFVLCMAQIRIAPVAHNVGEIEQFSRGSVGDTGLLLCTGRSRSATGLAFEPYWWFGVSYFRRFNVILLNSPWWIPTT